MNTNYNGVNVPHAPFVVTDGTACWWKLFAEGNYYTRHELPSRLLDVWHVTCFRVRDWVTHVIRGAGREFCQRRVGHRHSRPATTSDRCHFVFVRNLKRTLISNPIENGRRIHIEVYSGAPGRNTGRVSWFYLNSLGKWSGITDIIELTLTLYGVHCTYRSHFASLLSLVSECFFYISGLFMHVWIEKEIG